MWKSLTSQGGGVYVRTHTKVKDKAEEEKQERPPKPPGYRKFEKLLKQVVKAPPMKRTNSAITMSESEDAHRP